MLFQELNLKVGETATCIAGYPHKELVKVECIKNFEGDFEYIINNANQFVKTIEGVASTSHFISCNWDKMFPAFYKKTKKKLYLKFKGDFFICDNNAIKNVKDCCLQEQQKRAILDDNNWFKLGSYHDNFSAYSNLIKEMEKEESRIFHENRIITEKRAQDESWDKLSKLEVIPVTIENLTVVLNHLNNKNWGCWDLPRMSIGYSAHQYDCDGTIATTIKLDTQIDFCGRKESMFKVGGKFGHLVKFNQL